MSISFVSDRQEAIKLHWNYGFYEFRNMINIDRENRVRELFCVISSGKRNKVLKLLFFKWLYNELTGKELEFLFSFNEFLNDPVIYHSFRARSYGIKKKLLRERIKFIYSLTGNKFLKPNEYKSLQGSLRVSLFRGHEKLPRTPKYSGYTKHHRDHGSLGTGAVLDSIPSEWSDFDEENFIVQIIFGQWNPDEGYFPLNEILMRTKPKNL